MYMKPVGFAYIKQEDGFPSSCIYTYLDDFVFYLSVGSMHSFIQIHRSFAQKLIFSDIFIPLHFWLFVTFCFIGFRWIPFMHLFLCPLFMFLTSFFSLRCDFLLCSFFFVPFKAKYTVSIIPTIVTMVLMFVAENILCLLSGLSLLILAICQTDAWGIFVYTENSSPALSV